MSWGHAISKDLVNWQHLPCSHCFDALGTIFSGSAVVDTDNTAGFGAELSSPFTQTATGKYKALLTVLTTDTFTCYENNPVLTSDAFTRDLKSLWHKETRQLDYDIGRDRDADFSLQLSTDAESSFGEGQWRTWWRMGMSRFV